ncbi:MAG: Rrf2 family transcriptional regulator [Atopobiaceae bacterium]|nr:Rrf2 family transcriptional regulator [Atopobiaceae bacterium]
MIDGGTYGSFDVGGNIVEISKKLDYALSMLREVARAGEGEVVSVRCVAEKNHIPYSFARTIQHEMVKAGLLLTSRGPRGGMQLAVDARTTSLLDVVEAIDGPVDIAGVRVDEPDADDASGHFRPVWQELARLTRGYLGSVTLYELVIEDLVPYAGGDMCFELRKNQASQEAHEGR